MKRRGFLAAFAALPFVGKILRNPTGPFIPPPVRMDGDWEVHGDGFNENSWSNRLDPSQALSEQHVEDMIRRLDPRPAYYFVDSQWALDNARSKMRAGDGLVFAPGVYEVRDA